MRVAIIGSRGIKEVDFKRYLPSDVSLIVSGGAKGVDSLAESYAKSNNIPTLLFLPEYQKFGRTAPLVRNRLIVNNADIVIAFWDGESRGTRYTIDYAKSIGKPTKVFLVT